MFEALLMIDFSFKHRNYERGAYAISWGQENLETTFLAKAQKTFIVLNVMAYLKKSKSQRLLTVSRKKQRLLIFLHLKG